MTTPVPPKLQPALLGGLLIGVLSALPVVSLGNCCCLWVIGGGALATYLMQQNYPYQVSAADGALVGLLAGVFGGIIGTFVSVPIEMLMGPLQQRLLEHWVLSNPDLPPETRSIFENMAARGLAPVMIAIRLVFAVIVGAVFAMLGGLLGVALFKKNVLPPPPPPPGTIDVLPPQA